MTSKNDAERTTEGVSTSGDSEEYGSSGVSRRGFLRATGAAGASVALTGTGAAETTESTAGREQTAQQDGDTLRLINASMTTLDPIKAEDTASSEVTVQVFDGLLTWPNGGLA